MNRLRKLYHSARDLIYPPVCLHCREIIPSSDGLFCKDCLPLLEMIDPALCCPYCFSYEYSPEEQICPVCRTLQLPYTRIAAVFDYEGPAASLIKKFKYGDGSYLSQGAAAYMAAQFLHMDWPMPDVIIPVPISLTHWIVRGYNQSMLLAQGLSSILGRPVQQSLRRTSGDFSQAGLNHKQRLGLTGQTITLKKKQFLEDKTILLVDDVLTTGTTLKKCAEALQEACPQSIYALTVCRSMQ